MALMDETACDTSCDESDQSCSDGSECKRTIKDDDWTSGDDYEPLRKITKPRDSKDRIKIIYSSDSSEENEEFFCALENLSWHPVTGQYMKHFPYEAQDVGVSKEAIADLGGKAPYDFFKYLMTNDIIEYVAEKTNIYALRELGNESLPAKSRLTKWKEVSSEEMEKFLGILLWMELCKMPKVSDYWSKNPLYRNEIKNVMSRNRFEILLRMWHFSEDESHLAADRTFKIKPLVDKLFKRFQRAMTPEKNVCISQSLLSCQWQSSDVNDKSLKHGVQLFKLCSSEGYVYDLRLLQGNGVKSSAQISSSIVLSLMKNLLDGGRILYTDAYCTSIPLAHRLLRRTTHLVGTLSNDGQSNPEELIGAKLAKDEEVSMESNTGVIVLKWKHKVDDLMLSTISQDNLGKREAMIDRKNSISLLERLNRSKCYSGCLRRGTKWYQRLAVELTIGAALSNAFILYKALTGTKIKLTQFKEEVATKLLRLEEKVGTLSTSPVNPTTSCELRSMGSARRRCTVCYERLKNEHGREYASARCKQSAYKCVTCDLYFCIECFFIKHTAKTNKA